MKKWNHTIFAGTMLALIVSLNLAGIMGLQALNIGVCLTVLVVVILGTAWKLVHCALFFTFLSVSGSVLAWFRLPEFWLLFLLPLIVSTAIIFPFPATRQALDWLRIGQIDRMSWTLLGITSSLSVAALLLWAYWTDNLGAGTRIMQPFRPYPWRVIVCLVIPVFALINAVLEEAVYRGILQTALMQVFRNIGVVIVLQASAFAAIHFAAGFPNGVIGYLMVLAWGLMLGYLRIRTNGLLIPYLAHIIADLVIGYILYGYS